MNPTDKTIKLTQQQQRILKLLFKFRFVSSKLLAQVLDIRTDSTYEALEHLVANSFVIKVYEKSFRIDRKAAYYYLSKSGVTTVRRLLDVKESVVHALYKNDTSSSEFIEHSLDVLACYPFMKQNLPDGSDLFTKSEINHYKQFPKNRPDLYLRTPDGREAVVIFVHDSALFIGKKRLDEIIAHSEDEGWPNGSYPTVAFVVRDVAAEFKFLYAAARKLDSMGIDQEDLMILAAPITSFGSDQDGTWSSVYNPKKFVTLLANS